MTAAAFQSALARLIVDPAFRERVREEGAPALRGRPLDPGERARLLAAAGDPGMAVTATLHRGFRLSKLLGRLPLTFTLLDAATSQRELGAFWAARTPTSLYYLEEAIAFCDHLLARADHLDVPYLAEIVGYERAGLELQRARPDGADPPLEWVEFEHDPLPLIGEVAAGRIPANADRRRCFLIGRRIGDEAEWRLADPIDVVSQGGCSSPPRPSEARFCRPHPRVRLRRSGRFGRWGGRLRLPPSRVPSWVRFRRGLA
ncbi:MAG TPA: hypothetical protein VM617_04895 [Thermoanaerobaculia bacterium]|nr:hypothetical protein [Thermoanaerobaculia bacterium]